MFVICVVHCLYFCLLSRNAFVICAIKNYFTYLLTYFILKSKLVKIRERKKTEDGFIAYLWTSLFAGPRLF